MNAKDQIAVAPHGASRGHKSETVTNKDPKAIRPFRINVPEGELTELHRGITATKWPEKETVTDATQGVQLATIQALARYWATEYDWRKLEARLNALPQFITEIDGLDIHFIRVRSKHEGALPLIVSAVVTVAEVVDSISELSVNPVQPRATCARSSLCKVSTNRTATIAFSRF